MNSRHGVLSAIILLALSCAAQHTSPPKIPAASTYSISGTVVNAGDGLPIANAEIYLGVPSAEDESAQEELLSNATGEFVFKGLSAGKYVVKATKKGLLPEAYGAQQHYFIAIAVGPDCTAPAITLKLHEAGSISGFVRGDEDVPLYRADVSLYRNEFVDGLRHTFLVTNALSDHQGRYHFGSLPAGSYYLAVKAETEFSDSLRTVNETLREVAGEEHEDRANDGPANVIPAQLDVTYPVTYYPAALNPGGAQSLLLHTGEKLQADLQLQSVRAVHLNIPRQENITLSVASFDGERLEIGQVPILSGTSEWKTIAIAPGMYKVAIQECDQGTCMSTGPELELAEDAQIEHDQLTEDRVHITGTATMQDGTTASNIFVRLVPEHSITLETDKIFQINDGKMEWRGMLPPGRYTVELDIPSSAPASLFLESLLVTGAKAHGTTVEVSSGGPLHFSIVATRKSGRVEGKVLSGGNPVSGAMVLLVPKDFQSNTDLFRMDESDSDGTFGFRPVPQGNYIAIAIQNGWELEWAKPEILRPYLPKGTAINLAADSLANIKIELQQKSKAPSAPSVAGVPSVP